MYRALLLTARMTITTALLRHSTAYIVGRPSKRRSLQAFSNGADLDSLAVKRANSSDGPALPISSLLSATRLLSSCARVEGDWLHDSRKGRIHEPRPIGEGSAGTPDHLGSGTTRGNKCWRARRRGYSWEHRHRLGRGRSRAGLSHPHCHPGDSEPGEEEFDLATSPRCPRRLLLRLRLEQVPPPAEKQPLLDGRHHPRPLRRPRQPPLVAPPRPKPFVGLDTLPAAKATASSVGPSTPDDGGAGKTATLYHYTPEGLLIGKLSPRRCHVPPFRLARQPRLRCRQPRPPRRPPRRFAEDDFTCRIAWYRIDDLDIETSTPPRQTVTPEHGRPARDEQSGTGYQPVNPLVYKIKSVVSSQRPTIFHQISAAQNSALGFAPLYPSCIH